MVDLGGQDEIVLGQPADGVGRQFDRDVAVTGQMQVGVMVLSLGDVTDAELERLRADCCIFENAEVLVNSPEFRAARS